MGNRSWLIRLKYLVIPTFVSLLSVGCIGNFKKDAGEITVQNVPNNAFEQENNMLLQEVEALRNREAESNKIREIAEDNLNGTGIEVGVKDDGSVSLTLPSSYFGSGKASLKKDAKADLRKISVLLNQQFYDHKIRIEGHTDNQPIKNKKNKFKTNWELSTARAISVLYYFTNKCGVSPGKMYIAGFAEHDPVATNSTKRGRSRNRRIEVVIIP
ncbi:MAG: OmpA/MotB family protein [Candidatus Anammoxibacter sp.]